VAANGLFAVIIPVKGEPFVVCPAFERDRAAELIALGPFAGEEADIPHVGRTMKVRSSGSRRGLKGSRGLPPGGSAWKKPSKFVFADGIAQAAPQLKVVSGTPVDPRAAA
jgi:Xaa-Pro dipeptidase